MPDWHCPYCKRGWLKFVPPLGGHKSHTQETLVSELLAECYGFDPQEVAMKFTAILTCGSCERVTYCAGNAFLEPIVQGESYTQEWETTYSPLVFIPAIPLCDIPADCPSDVQKVIYDSFALAWLDLSATGNKLRVAIEMLLAHIDPALKPDFTKKRSLGKCINAYCKINPFLGEHLKAIKWLGNDASHDDALTECDIAVAYQILEEVLRQLYPPQKNVTGLVKLINARKGSPLSD